MKWIVEVTSKDGIVYEMIKKDSGSPSYYGITRFEGQGSEFNPEELPKVIEFVEWLENGNKVAEHLGFIRLFPRTD